MPAYFGMSLQFLRKDLSPGFVAEFDALLEQTGLRFASGRWEDGSLSQTEIAAWNQKKLDKNFELDDYFLELGDRSQDYKVSLYQFGNYTEVQGGWLNQFPEANAFAYLLSIPECEVLEYNLTFRDGAIKELIELAQKLWQFPAIKAIQTELAESDAPLGLTELRQGIPPDLSPFALVEPDCHPYDDGSQVISLTQGRPGLLLLDPDLFPGSGRSANPTWGPPPGGLAISHKASIS